MNKKQVQQRILKDGKPLALSKFSWCEETNTFSSNVDGLVIDFDKCDFITITAGVHCTIKTGWDCTITTGWNCTITTGSYCTITTSSYCTITTSSGCTITTYSDCTITAGWNCTIKTGSDCVIVRSDIFEVIQPKAGDTIQIFPYKTKGYLTNGLYQGKPHIIADGIVSEVLSQKGNVFKVRNLGEDRDSWLIKGGNVYSHGATLQEARDSLVYKISNRDTTEYEDYKPSDIVTRETAIKMYRCITGACEGGVRGFVEAQAELKDEYTISELIELTKGQFRHEEFKEFFERNV